MDLVRFIFACSGIFANTIYWHHLLHIRFKIFAQIRIQIFDLMLKIHVAANICFRANICLRLSHTGEPNICLEANICKTLIKFHIQANICLQIFTHSTSEYSLAIFAYQQIFAMVASNYLGQSFTSLRPQLIFGSFWKSSLRKEYSLPFLFGSHVKSADSVRCKTNW